MKKLLVIILSLCLVLSTTVYASGKAIIGFDSAQKDGSTATLPVYISELPDGFEEISALTYWFVYDNSVIEFKEIKDGTIEGIAGYFNKPNADVGKCIISWYDATKELTKSLTADKVGKSNPLFYVEFEILDETPERAFINIEKAVVTDGNLKSSTKDDVTTLAGVINISAEISGGESGDEGDDGDDNEDNNNGDDNYDDNNTDNDNSGNGNNGSGSGAGTGGGPLKPSTGGNNSGGSSSGGSSSGGSSSGGSSSGGSSSGGSSSGGSSSGGSSSGGSSSGSTSSTGSTVGGDSADTSVNAPEKDEPIETPAQIKASDIFSDVDDDHWAASHVVKLSKSGIISGDDKGRANLGNNITRAEIAKIALLVKGVDIKSDLTIDATDSADVPAWAYNYIATAMEEKIFTGGGDGSIKAINNITRAEVVSVIIKMLGIDVTDAGQSDFADVEQSHWASKSIAKSVELGFVTGYTDNTFKPSNQITRAEAFAIFARVMDYLEK